jgi:hypothetical protein
LEFTVIGDAVHTAIDHTGLQLVGGEQERRDRKTRGVGSGALLAAAGRSTRCRASQGRAGRDAGHRRAPSTYFGSSFSAIF